MFKPSSLQRVQAALQVATGVVSAQPKADTMNPAELAQTVIALATLLLEEDDRQSKSIILPVRG